VIDLKGKCALITGSGQGIGKEIAVTLAKAGANIGVSDINLEAAQATADEIAKLGVKTIALKANVASDEEVKAMVKDFVAEMGQIDILVNNAGITKDGLVMRMKEADWDAVLNVNLKSAFLCTKAVTRHMVKQSSGKIINIASISGVIGLPGQANYSASKAGMIGLTKAVAKELYGKTVLISVGGIDSAHEAYKRIKAGASLVQILSGLIFHGPDMIMNINNELIQLLKADGYENISQAVGADRK